MEISDGEYLLKIETAASKLRLLSIEQAASMAFAAGDAYGAASDPGIQGLADRLTVRLPGQAVARSSPSFGRGLILVHHVVYCLPSIHLSRFT